MGTPEGAAKAKKTIVDRHGKDFYHKIGKVGGAASSTGGFASEKVGEDGRTGKDRARYWGAIGGKRSRRVSKKA